MSYIYAMSDIHGDIDAFLDALGYIDLSGRNQLILLGDYIHGRGQSVQVVDKIMELQEKYGEKVVALMGNHEKMVIEGFEPLDELNPEQDNDRYLDFLAQLPLYYTTDYNQVFCHAGIAEEAGEYWEETTTNWDFTQKFPAEVLQPNDEKLCVDVIAGHIHSDGLYKTYTGDIKRYEIFSDGSHYYIDGNTINSGIVLILRYDTETGKYAEVTNGGLNPVMKWWEDI